MVLNNLIEIHLIPPFASDFKSNLFSQVKFSYNKVYLTYIQIVLLKILPNYQCIKGTTIESIVVPSFFTWKHHTMQLNFIIGMVLQYNVLLDLFYTGVHTLNVRCAPIREIYDSITLTCTNCLNWLKSLRIQVKIDLMKNCIVGLKIYHKYYH